MLLVEAAGFDVVLVETVGVGQSETAVAEMVDLFVLLVSPGGGDDLQGIKRGVMELADLLLVTKADGDLQHAANRAVADYRMALHLMRPKFPGIAPGVHAVSAVEGTGHRRGLDGHGGPSQGAGGAAPIWTACAGNRPSAGSGARSRPCWPTRSPPIARVGGRRPGRGRCHGGPAAAPCRRPGADCGLSGLIGPGVARFRLPARYA